MAPEWGFLLEVEGATREEHGMSNTLATFTLPRSLTWGEDRTEPNTVAPAERPVAAAERRPAVPGVEAPTAAAKHAAGARRRTLRIGHTPNRIITNPIQTPLPHIPVHVVKSKGVGRVTPHRRRPIQIRPVRIIDSPRPSSVFGSPIEIRHPRP